MTNEYIIGAISQIPRGEGRNFDLGGTIVAVFRNHTDEIFATQQKCPHREGPLADGLVGGKTLICPLHEMAFDLRTGVAIGHEACLTVYQTRINSKNMISVKLS